jgi:cation:H+ antiporter
MLLQVIILIIGFIVLIKGADIFVDGASSIALNLKLSKMLIGLTIVAFGTSAPEFAVSVKSILSGNADMLLGNVIGSNILNILLIIGICSLIHPIYVKSNTVKKEIPIVMLISGLLFFLVKDDLFIKNINEISRNDGFIILLFFMIFIYYLISIMRNKTDEDSDDMAKFGIGKSILFTIFGIVCIVIGSNVVVDSASKIATMLGVSQRMIALTVVAFGTSLPELVTSIVSIRKGEQEILVGNIVGSNIFNIGVVLGIPVALFGGIPAIGFSLIDLVVMIIAAILLFIFSFKDRKIDKFEGVIMLIIFMVYYTFVIIG